MAGKAQQEQPSYSSGTDSLMGGGDSEECGGGKQDCD